MISAGDFKNGLTIELEGNVYQIVDFQHVKPGKGAAFVRTKMKNIKNGGRENDMVKMISHNGDIFAVEPPMFAELEVTECEPGEKGNTATGATKPCTVETGAVVYVPLFVNLGDKLKIDTRTGEYLSRV